ncbi:hypothetical protein D0Z00_001409 [Geotrichum galactomycetum]|uniref:Uncharacterized protein n=1 Tax=Geotrichum galactomycetum TaxID=27317 RepID=A0ACB6V6X9_9ASCO|nr:hypothetical protein D0Z00_001409 [Geotrichum candidum]
MSDHFEFSKSPQREVFIGRSADVFIDKHQRRRSSVLTKEERKGLIKQEEELLIDNKILTYNSFANSSALDDDSDLEEQVIKTNWEEAVAQNLIHTTYSRELKVLLKNTLPSCMTFLLQYSLTVVSVFVVGHLGKNELSAVSLAGMIANICGYGIFQGIATCLDTLGAQAYGRGDYDMVGIYTQRCALLMGVVLVPVLFLWCNAEMFLDIFVPQKECVILAARYLKVLAIGCPGYVIFEIAKHYLQAQGIFKASTYVLLFCAPMNIILNYIFVWSSTLGFGFIGAPIAVVITDYTMALIALMYIAYIDGSKCWKGWSNAALSNWSYMCQLALSGVITIEAEWLAFEVLTFAAAHLGTTELATQTVLATLCVLAYQVPLSMGIAASTRVGNLIGAKLIDSAAMACKTGIYTSLVFGTLNGIILFASRNHIGALFTSDPDVIKTVAQVLPYGAMYQINDSISAVTSGLLRGQGRQKISGVVNLVAYYIFALPVGLFLAFNANWGLSGLWSGVCLALLIVSSFQTWYVIYADWHAILEKAENEFTA